jgi:hypothetical protein
LVDSSEKQTKKEPEPKADNKKEGLTTYSAKTGRSLEDEAKGLANQN